MSELRMASSWPAWMTQPRPKLASAVIQYSPPRPLPDPKRMRWSQAAPEIELTHSPESPTTAMTQAVPQAGEPKTSMWPGLSNNKKIIRLARSMITTGYRQDEPINCRTSDLTASDGVLAGKLLFSDGQAHGLAARLAFHSLLNTVRTSQDSLMGDPEIMRIMQGLLQIPTVISTGGSTGEDLIIAQAVRQNVKASMQLPMNAMPHWRSIPTMSSLWQSVPGGAIARALLRPQQQ